MFNRKSSIIVFFLFSFLISNGIAYSQENKEINDIELEYKLTELPDSAKIKILHDSIWFYFDRDLNVVKRIIPIFKHYVNTIGDERSKVDYYMVLGAYFNYLNLNDSAILYMEHAINMMNSKNKNFSGKLDNIYHLPSIYNNIALIYDDMGMYESAVEFQLKSINVIKEIRVRDTLNVDINELFVTDYVELAIMFSNFNDTINAKKYFSKGIHLAKLYDDEYLIAYSNLNYGVFLADIEEYDLAIEYINNSKKYYDKKNNTYNHLIINLNIAKILAKQDKPEQAIALADSVLKIADIRGFYALKLSTLEILFYIYYDINDIEKTIEIGNRYLHLVTDQNRHIGSNHILSTLSEIYNKRGDYKKAYEYLSISKKLTDSINNIDHRANASILESKYNLIQRNTENEVLVRENNIKDKYIKKNHKTRSIIISLLIISVVFGFIVLVSLRRIKKINLKLKQSNKSLEKKSIELAQYNSALENVFGIFTHDLKGPIGTADMFFRMLENDENSISEEKKSIYIRQIGKSMKVTFSMLENLLYWSKHRMDNKINVSEFSISSLIDNIIENIELTLFTKNIRFSNNIDSSIILNTDENYLRIVLRNIISNAVKFTKDNGEISINYLLKDNKHQVSIIDNGVGMPEEQAKNLFKTKSPVSNLGTNNERGTGIGLLISLELVKSLGGRINVNSRKDIGSTFSIILPIK